MILNGKSGDQMIDKIKGISFTINNTELTKMELMPEYATVIRLFSIRGQDKVNIHYPLKYPPANYNSWQQLGRVMILIKRIFHTAQFEDVDATGSFVYTLDEFASYFPDFVEMPKPFYPQEVKDYMKHLTFYAQRLHFKGMLNIGLLNAMAIKFNTLLEKPYSIKEVYKKSFAIYRLDRDGWKISTGRRNTQTATERRIQIKQEKIEIISSHLEEFTDEKNVLDINSLSNHLGIPVKTIYRLKPAAIACSDHITTRNEKTPRGALLADEKSSTILQDEMRIDIPDPQPNENEMRKSDNYPDSLNVNAFKMWCNYKGKSYSKQAQTLSINKLIKYDKQTQIETVETSIMNGWKGLFEPKQQNQSNQSNQRNEIIDDFFSGQNAEVIDAN